MCEPETVNYTTKKIDSKKNSIMTTALLGGARALNSRKVISPRKSIKNDSKIKKQLKTVKSHVFTKHQ